MAPTVTLAAIAVATVLWAGPLIARRWPDPASNGAVIAIAAWAGVAGVALTIAT